MARDSKQWDAAYKAFRDSAPRVLDRRPTTPRTERRPEPMVLMHEYDDNLRELARLKLRQREIRKQLAGQKMMKGDYYSIPIKLYLLRLEDDCWYVGMSRRPHTRFKKHASGKGAAWTKRHRPIQIVEVRDTRLTDDRAVCKLEDDMTIEIAMKYGSQYVRGGGYLSNEAPMAGRCRPE